MFHCDVWPVRFRNAGGNGRVPCPVALAVNGERTAWSRSTSIGSTRQAACPEVQGDCLHLQPEDNSETEAQHPEDHVRAKDSGFDGGTCSHATFFGHFQPMTGAGPGFP